LPDSLRAKNGDSLPERRSVTANNWTEITALNSGIYSSDVRFLPARHTYFYLSLSRCTTRGIYGSKTIEVPVHALRQRELLAYLALPARARETRWDDLISKMYEARLSEDETTETQQRNLYNDVKALRHLLEQACTDAELPYLNPIEVSGPRQNGLYRLADGYELVDIATLERLAQERTPLEQPTKPARDRARQRATYTTVLARCKEGFLGHQVPQQRTGVWAKDYYAHYQSLYHHLLWDLAEEEYALGGTQHGEERNASLRQAVWLYEQCALLTAPTSKEDLAEGDQANLSEQALRQCLLVYSLLGNQTRLRHIYSHYVRMMQRRYRGWKLEPQTTQVFEELTRSPNASN
jgi:hypothetical protein